MHSYRGKVSPVGWHSLKEITLKPLLQVALLSGQKAKSLHLMDVRNVTLSNSSCKVRFCNLLKTSKHGKHQSEIIVTAFVTDSVISVL